MKQDYRDHLTAGERAGERYVLTVPHDALAGYMGTRTGHLAGSSIDFRDYREYQPGDDLRHIDWHVYARTDRLTVKLYREEVYPHVDIVLDGSRSMALDGTAKAQAALGLAALLAVAAANAHCTHHAWLAANRIREVPNSAQSPSAWDDLAFDFGGNPAEAFQAPPAWRKRGIRVLLSDLLWLCDPLSALQPLSHGAAAVIVVQLLGQADVEPPTLGNIRLRDVENDERLEMFIDAVARSRYADALTAHQQNWHRACRQVGAVFITLVAERVLGDWSLAALEAAQVLEPA